MGALASEAVEFPSMPRTYNLISLDKTIGEKAAIVRAGIRQNDFRTISQDCDCDFSPLINCWDNTQPSACFEGLVYC